MEFGTELSGAVKEQLCLSDSPVEVEVRMSRPPGLRQVANIIVALKRMQQSQKLISSELTDHQLLNIMMESVFEEHVVLDEHNPTCSSGSTFWRSAKNVDVIYSVCNSEQRKLVRSPDDSELHAVALQAMVLKHTEFYNRIVKLSLSTYMAGHLSPSQGQPVALGIANTNLYMSCCMKSGAPVLQLEPVDSKDKLATIFSKGEKERFLFFKKGSGFASTKFESAKFRGWYISTGPGCDAPVEMCCSVQEATRLTSFIVKKQ